MFLKRRLLTAGVVIFVGLASGQFTPVAVAQTKAQKAAPRAEVATAKVFFYRENLDPQGIGRKAVIYIDGQEVVNLSGGRYFMLLVPVGQHTFSGPDQQQAAPMEVQVGQDYYFKAKVDRSSAKKFVAIHNAFRIDLINPKLGEIDVAKLKPQDADAAPKGPKQTGTSY